MFPVGIAKADQITHVKQNLPKPSMAESSLLLHYVLLSFVSYQTFKEIIKVGIEDPAPTTIPPELRRNPALKAGGPSIWRIGTKTS